MFLYQLKIQFGVVLYAYVMSCEQLNVLLQKNDNIISYGFNLSAIELVSMVTLTII